MREAWLSMGSTKANELQRGSQFCSGNGQTDPCSTKGALGSILLPKHNVYS